MEYFCRLKNFWFPDWMALVWLVFTLPALYFFQTVIHEGTHAVSALMVTGHFPKLAPYPHSNRSGNFLNGVTIADDNELVTVSRRQNCDENAPVVDIRRMGGYPPNPQFVALGISVILTFIFIFTSTANPYVRLGLRAWYLGACIDFMYGTARGLGGGCNESADWSKFMLEADIGTGWFAFMTWMFWILILLHFLWVYWSRWGRDAVIQTCFWDYRWFAFLLGCLSFLAVLLSLVIGDNNIDKGSAAYIVPLILQILFLCWYWIYFGLTYKYQS